MRLELVPIIDGNPAGETIVFIQGWPDTPDVWDEAVRAVGSTYRCVRVSFPNFDGRAEVREGFGTDEIVDALEKVVRDVAARGPVTLVLHDWGCYWGHAVHHRLPHLVSRLAGVDIAPHFKPAARDVPWIVAYQSYLYGAFVIGGVVGELMTRAFAVLGKMPNARTRPLTAWANYPYRNIWGDLASGRTKALTRGYWPTCPLLFVYGEEKPFHLHGRNWVDHVKKTGGEVIGLPLGHWIPPDPAFVRIFVRWLAETRSKAASAVVS